MIIRKDNFVLDVDVDSTARYSNEHALCDCNEDRNFYAQARERFPKLTAFLAELGVEIDRPDETGSHAEDNCIDYHFVSYTVVGDILEADKYEVHLFDGDRPLHLVIDHWYVPNEQKTNRYFTVTVYNIQLPWVLDEPFPTAALPRSFFKKIKDIFHKK